MPGRKDARTSEKPLFLLSAFCVKPLVFLSLPNPDKTEKKKIFHHEGHEGSKTRKNN